MIERRLLLFHAETKPLLDFYAERGILVTIDAVQPADAGASRSSPRSLLIGRGSARRTVRGRSGSRRCLSAVAGVSLWTAVDEVVAVLAEQLVVANLAVQVVVRRSAAYLVIAVAAEYPALTSSPRQGAGRFHQGRRWRPVRRPPQMTSSPPKPLIQSFPPSPTITSGPGVPEMFGVGRRPRRRCPRCRRSSRGVRCT